MNEPLLRVEGLSKHFPVQARLLRRSSAVVRAVDGVDFTLGAGQTLGIVGESGCGKSTLGRLVLRLIEPTDRRVVFGGNHLASLNAAALRAQRRAMQIIFQDPFSSLNPRMTVGQILAEPLHLHGLHRGTERERVAELLHLVGLAGEHAQRYPHEFSGGQRQRVGIARALAVEPQLIVCDEAVSALDVSVQAQVINLLQDLQQRLGLAYIFIAHNLAVVRHIATRVAVMYLGRIVELADTRALFAAPRHPYTQALLSAIPVAEPPSDADSGPRAQRRRVALTGDVPNPIAPPPGCAFHTRCAHARAACSQQLPALVIDVAANADVAADGAAHATACIRWPEIVPAATSAPTPARGRPQDAERLRRLQSAFMTAPSGDIR